MRTKSASETTPAAAKDWDGFSVNPRTAISKVDLTGDPGEGFYVVLPIEVPGVQPIAARPERGQPAGLLVPGSHEGGVALARAAYCHWHEFIWAVSSDDRWLKARTHGRFDSLMRAALYAADILIAARIGLEASNKDELSAQDAEKLRVALREVDVVKMSVAKKKELAAEMERMRTAQPRDAAKTGRKKRQDYSEVLAAEVARLDGLHPEWSHVRMAEELENTGFTHVRTRLPYTPRHIGGLRNEGRAAERSKRKHTR